MPNASFLSCALVNIPLRHVSAFKTGDLGTFMKWVDAKRRLRVLTNADTPADAKVAISNGAQVGL
jgi:hypothetical protein